MYFSEEITYKVFLTKISINISEHIYSLTSIVNINFTVK